jgi:thymidylate kinase
LVFIEVDDHQARERMHGRNNPTSAYLQRTYDKEELEGKYRRGYEELQRFASLVESNQSAQVVRIDSSQPTDKSVHTIVSALESEGY